MPGYCSLQCSLESFKSWVSSLVHVVERFLTSVFGQLAVFLAGSGHARPLEQVIIINVKNVFILSPLINTDVSADK